MKFDGRGFADKIELDLVDKVRNLASKPKIVSVLVGNDPASKLYTRLKKEAAERVGIQFDVLEIDLGFKTQDLQEQIVELGNREDVSGMMIQLPVPGLQGQTLQEVLKAIPPEKDVDGLRYPESGVIPPVVKAILSIIEQIDREKFTIYNLQFTNIWEQKFVVMGAGGSVGSVLCNELQKHGVLVLKVDSDTNDPTRMILEGQVVISCVGKAGVVTGEMVQEGAIVIDVGAPKGDMAKEVYQKASVSVEVPGGVGPVTIATLMENALEISLCKR
ncbi:bifunctional 5,10-methylenetetrahydrofolate dehydrogenase/5,10-methenyltetrahydrofolate cyclohydrolase [Candidatus Woesebacteria bacterium]|nr:bifunctional 5,10-methylenetetrahydrofolate dehydrogenase/5,10-methenyltetrahydrofolate cyclohydrolase [Candidatus Woesebacteria bacterium]